MGDPSAVVADPEAAGFSAERLHRISDLLRADTALDGTAAHIPGAVALVMRQGRLAYFEAFGFADVPARRAMQLNSIFRIASMTKPLTVTAALSLMERGKLVLSDPVTRFIPEFRDLKVGVESVDPLTGERQLRKEPLRRTMTLHDLMRHTAGFTYGQFGDSLVQRAYRQAHMIDNAQSNADMVAKLATLPLCFQPGTGFEYGMATDVLGRIVELIANDSLDRVLADLILDPLGMSSTGFGVSAANLERLAEPQRDASPGTVPAVIPYDPARPTRWHSGGGGLLSCAVDYARYCQALLNGGELDGDRILARKSVELMTRNHLPVGLAYATRTGDLGIAAPLPELGMGYGLGVGVRVEAGLAPVPGSVGDFHWGGALGPYFWVDPSEKLLVVFMLQELNVQRRARYRSLLRNLVYQALS